MKKSIFQQSLSEKQLVKLIDKRIQKILDKSKHKRKSCKFLKILLYVFRFSISFTQVFNPFK